MANTLYTDAGNFRAFKILVAAEYNNVQLNIPDFKLGDNKSADYLKKSPMGKVPCLTTPNGSIFESNAIARYVARMRRDTELYGVSFFESAQVDSWIDFCNHDLELPATVWFYPVLGYMQYNESATAKAKADMSRALSALNNHLSDKTYLVGQKITLADITIATTLVYPFKFVADAAFRGQFPHVMRWFDTCVHQKQFMAVIGNVVLCTKELTAGGAPIVTAKGKGGKKENKEKAPKEKKEKAAPQPKKEVKEVKEEEPAPKPVKKEHIFKIMDQEKKSDFSMDEWKRIYSNCDGDYKAAMDQFWQMYDAEGWSLFRGDYNYNDDNKVLFMTGNLLGGFIQRTEEIRKWLFGTMTIRGEEKAGGMKVSAYFLIRGQEIKPLLDANDDAEYYTWTRVATPVSDADKAKIFEYWTSDTQLEGETCLDSRCYK